MTNNGKIAIVAGLAAVVCAAYGTLIYNQGKSFDTFAQNPNKYLGEDVPEIGIKITKSSFFSREFEVFPLEEPTTVLAGKTNFGFSPTSEIRLTPFGSPVLQDVIKQASPVLTTSYNFKYEPKDFAFKMNPVSYKDGRTLVELGKISADGKVDFQNKEETEIQSLDLNFNAERMLFKDGIYESMGADNVTVKFKASADNANRISVDSAVKNAVFKDSSGTLILDSGKAAVQLGLKGNEFIQNMSLELQNGRIVAYRKKFDINSVNSSLALHFPNNKVLFAAVANAVLGDDLCETLPLICPKENSSEQELDDILRQSILDGTTWLELAPSSIKTNEGNLDLLGQIRYLKDKPLVGNLDLKLITDNREVQALALMFLPRGSYNRVDQNTFVSKLTLEQTRDFFVFRANGKAIERFGKSF